METGSEDEVTSGEEKRSLPIQQKRQDWDLNEMQIEGMSHRTKNKSVHPGIPGIIIGLKQKFLNQQFSEIEGLNLYWNSRTAWSYCQSVRIQRSMDQNWWF